MTTKLKTTNPVEMLFESSESILDMHTASADRVLQVPLPKCVLEAGMRAGREGIGNRARKLYSRALQPLAPSTTWGAIADARQFLGLAIRHVFASLDHCCCLVLIDPIRIFSWRTLHHLFLSLVRCLCAHELHREREPVHSPLPTK